MLDRVEDQQEIITMLKNAMNKNRLNHAYLFHGEKGVGKMDVSVYLSLMMYCDSFPPCMSCSDCKQILSFEHMNVTLIEPIGKGIKKEQIKALQEEFSKTSLVKGPRIYIINHIDQISPAAANSLLKFIEEPPSDNIYAILLTENKNMVLPTIISRCADVSFKPLKKNRIIERLVESGLDEKTSNILAYITSNNEETEKYLESEIVDVFLDFVKTRTRKDASLFLLNNQTFLSSRENLSLLFKLLTVLYLDLFNLEFKNKKINLYSIKKDIIKYKEMYSYTKIKDNLDLILDLNTRLGANTIPKNIINTLMLNLF